MDMHENTRAYITGKDHTNTKRRETRNNSNQSGVAIMLTNLPQFCTECGKEAGSTMAAVDSFKLR